MKGLLELHASYSSRSSRSVMYTHLLLWLVLLLIHSTLTQDIMSVRPTASNTDTTVQSQDAFQAKTGFGTPLTSLFFVTELETLLPTDSTEIIVSESQDDTLAPSLLTDTVPTTLIGETSFTEISNLSSTELVTRMRRLCCPEGFLDVEGNCFRFENDEINFNGALDRCNFSSGGSLAKIDPIEPTTQCLLDITRYSSDSELIWIGLRRSGDNFNDTFTWTFDEATLNISNWAEGEPATNTSGNCATMSSDDGTWVLRPCSETHLPYICQSPPVFCAELTTAPEVTTEEFTTAEITEIITNATTTTAATTSSTTNAVTTIGTDAATTNRSTTAPTTMTTATKTSALLITTKLKRKPSPETTIDEDDEVTTEMMTEEETTKKSTTPTPSSLTTNRTSSPLPTSGGNVTTNVTIARPEGSTSRQNPTMTSQSTTTTGQPPIPPSGLSLINKILIAIIVIFLVLAIIIGCMVIYLIYKRKKGKQAVYNVRDVEMELEDIKSVEDLSGPSTSSGSGVANTSFISDDMPEFSGAHFSGLKGKSFSLDITSHSEA